MAVIQRNSRAGWAQRKVTTVTNSLSSFSRRLQATRLLGTMPYMPPELLTYIVAKDLTGKDTSRDEFLDRLKKFQRSTVIRLCSVLNLLLSKSAGDYDFEYHAKLARSFFHL